MLDQVYFHWIDKQNQPSTDIGFMEARFCTGLKLSNGIYIFNESSDVINH